MIWSTATPEQIAALAAEVLTGEHAAHVQLESRGDVLGWGQGDEFGYLAPDGSPLERVELGLRENGVGPPAEPEPGVFYDGEEYEPMNAEEVAALITQHRRAEPRAVEDFDPLGGEWAKWHERFEELIDWVNNGAPSRTMVVQFLPVTDQAELRGSRVPLACEVNADGEVFCTGCGDSEFEFRESIASWRTMRENADRRLVFSGMGEDGDGDDDPGVVCSHCERPALLPDDVTIDWAVG